MERIEIKGKLEAEGPGGAWTFIYFPKQVTEFLGTKGMVAVSGTITACRSKPRSRRAARGRMS